MRLVQTDAIVLHAFDYRETSRIVRLSTREHGVVSAVARGARRTSARFAQGMDLFTSGVAQLALHPVRDLHALNAFDTTHVRPELGHGMARFMAASALAEAALRFAREDESDRVHALLAERLDSLATAPPESAPWIALRGVWQMVAALGFAPALTMCASCHRDFAPEVAVTFHHRSGGALCASCSRAQPGGRQLPPDARVALIALLSEALAPDAGYGSLASLRAHQRLLREFLEEHVGDGRPLKAFLAWERHPARLGPAAQGESAPLASALEGDERVRPAASDAS